MEQETNRQTEEEGLLKRYEAYMDGRYSPLTIANYLRINGGHLASIGGDIAEISSFSVEKYVSRVTGHDADGNPERLASGTRNLEIMAIKNFADWLVYEGMLESHTVGKVKRFKVRQRVPESLETEEVEGILEVQDKSKPVGMCVAALIETMYSTGCRVSEVVNMKTDDIDFETGEAVVLGKGDKERMVMFTHRALEAVKAYLENGRPALEAASGEKSRFIFLRRDGRQMDRRTAWKYLRRSGEKAHVDGVHPHLMRHTFASHLCRNGVNLRNIQVMLGHASLETTQVYLKVSGNDIRESMKRLPMQ